MLISPQASVRPFKLAHESTLDSVSVLLLMAIFIADIHKVSTYCFSTYL